MPHLLLRAVPAALLAAGAALDGAAPVPFDAPAGLVVVRGRIDGAIDVRLLLDSGDPGGITLLAGGAEALLAPLPGGGTKRALGLAGARRVAVRRARLRTLELAGITARDLEVEIVPAPDPFLRFLGVEADGFIGAAVLRGRSIRIDYPRRRITFADGDAGPAGPEEGSSLRLAGGRIVVDAVLDGRARRALILDTAAAATLLAAENRDLTLPIPGEIATVIDGGGLTASLPARFLPSLSVGGTRLSKVRVALFEPGAAPAGLLATLPPSVAGILGGDLLAGSVVILDLRNGAFRMLPAGG